MKINPASLLSCLYLLRTICLTKMNILTISSLCMAFEESQCTLLLLHCSSSRSILALFQICLSQSGLIIPSLIGWGEVCDSSLKNTGLHRVSHSAGWWKTVMTFTVESLMNELWLKYKKIMNEMIKKHVKIMFSGGFKFLSWWYKHRTGILIKYNFIQMLYKTISKNVQNKIWGSIQMWCLIDSVGILVIY